MTSDARIADHVDNNLPALRRVLPSSSGLVHFPLEVGSLTVRGLGDSGSEAVGSVTPELLARLEALHDDSLAKLGFLVEDLATPVRRLTLNGLQVCTRRARIPSRALIFLRRESHDSFDVIDLHAERDWYYVLPALPEGAQWPFDLLFPTPAAVAGEDPSWGTAVVDAVRTGRAFVSSRVTPSRSDRSAPTLVQLLTRMGAVVPDPATGRLVDTDDDVASLEPPSAAPPVDSPPPSASTPLGTSSTPPAAPRASAAPVASSIVLPPSEPSPLVSSSAAHRAAGAPVELSVTPTPPALAPPSSSSVVSPLVSLADTLCIRISVAATLLSSYDSPSTSSRPIELVLALAEAAARYSAHIDTPLTDSERALVIPKLRTAHALSSALLAQSPSPESPLAALLARLLATLDDTTSRLTSSTPSSSAPRPRGRVLRRAAFDDDASPPPARHGRPLSATPAPRRLALASLHSLEAEDVDCLGSAPVDFSGAPVDVLPGFDHIPADVSDEDIHARIDFHAVTDSGSRPELAEYVRQRLTPVIRAVSGPIPPTHKLTWSLAFRLRDGARLPYRRQPWFKGAVLEQLHKQVDRLLAAGILERVPDGMHIRCNNMILMVPKPHTIDEWRLVVDLSGLNAIMIAEDICTLPRDLLALMQAFAGCSLFSSFDLQDAYYTIALTPECRDYTTVTVPGRGDRLRFTRAVMGGRHCGMVLHRNVNPTLKDAPAASSVVKQSVADDCLIGVRLSPLARDRHAQLVYDSVDALVNALTALGRCGCRIKLSKCFFLSRIGQLVGFITDGASVRNDPARIAHLRGIAPPSDIRGSRRLLGLVNAYSRFIPRATDLLVLVQQFVAQGRWPPSGLPDDVRSAFIQLRDSVADALPLYLLDPSLPVHCRADSSLVAAGGEIGQYHPRTGRWLPLGFYHHTFTATQRRYSTNVREFLALALLMLRYSHMLRDCNVIGWIDHSNLLFVSRSENPRILRIALMILGAGLNVSLMYEPGYRFFTPDALSRSAMCAPSADANAPDLALSAVALALASLSESGRVSPPLPAAESAVAEQPASASDPVFGVDPSTVSTWPHLVKLPACSVSGLPANVHLVVHHVVSAQQSLSAAARAAFLKRDYASEKRLGSVMVLLLAGRLFVPASAALAQLVYLSSVHDAYHSTAADMISRLRLGAKVQWDSMVADAERYCASCGSCQHVAAGVKPLAVGRMTSFLYPRPNHTLLIDFFGPLDECVGASPFDATGTKLEYRYIITLVDGYSRFALFIPSTHKSAAAAAAAFRHWCFVFNAPSVVRSDSDAAFLSEEFRAVLASAGSAPDPVPPYTHHSMGLLERVHKPLADALRRLGGHATSEWIDFIGLIAQWRNTSVNRDLGISPHEAMFCRPPAFAYDRLGISEVTSVTPNELANLSAAVDVLVRSSAAVSSSLVAAQYDSERSAPPTYRSGDKVLVYFPDRDNKCLTFYRGPFEVLSAADDDGHTPGNYYNVRDVVQLREYRVHVERLKPFDDSRTSLPEQQARQLESREFGIVAGVDAHRMNEAQGLYEFCIRFYSGYRAWQLYPFVQKLDVVKAYVAEHGLNVRKQTPDAQFARLTGQRPSAARPPRKRR